jgi:hypothetical protein
VTERTLFSNQNILNGLTLLISIGWLVTFVLRMFKYEIEGTGAIDAWMLIVIGFWFSNRAIKMNGSSKPGEDAKATT